MRGPSGVSPVYSLFDAIRENARFFRAGFASQAARFSIRSCSSSMTANSAAR